MKNYDNWYVVLTGDYRVSGHPENMVLSGVVPRSGLKQLVNECLGHIKKGMDVYVLTPDKQVKAIIQEKLVKYFR